MSEESPSGCAIGARRASISASGNRRVQAVDDALPVVEVEQHLGLLRDRAEQIAELAERARANHVAVVLDEGEAVRRLADGRRRSGSPRSPSSPRAAAARSASRAAASPPGSLRSARLQPAAIR